MEINIQATIDIADKEQAGKAIGEVYRRVCEVLTTPQAVSLPGMPAPIPTVKVRYPEPEADNGKV